MSELRPLTALPMQRFSILLWEPQDPINMGSVIRVCRNTNLHDLRMVRPRIWDASTMTVTAPHSDAFIQGHVQQFQDFEQATQGLHRLYALTARGRRDRQQRYRMDEIVTLLQQPNQADLHIGFVFGREDSGLPNDIVDRCDGYITLESSPLYSSMNLAQAVLLVAWSLFKSVGHADPLRPPQREWPLAEHAQMSRMMQDAESAMDSIGVFRGDQRENVLRTVRQVFHRAEMDTQELATFWGVFKAILNRDRY